jgi:NADH dehydrogenase
MSIQPYGTASRPHVVVLGAGFAGVECARELAGAHVDVTLVDRHAYNTFQPLLYQVATAALNPGDITFFLRALHSGQANMRFRQSEVVGVDPAAKQVTLATGPPLTYDYLVITNGVTANYFGVPGAEDHAFALYTRNEALACGTGCGRVSSRPRPSRPTGRSPWSWWAGERPAWRWPARWVRCASS